MHIADGILSWQVLAAGAGLSALGTAWGLSKLKNEDLPKAACAASAFFIASLIHLPIGPGSAHLLLNGLAGIVLGAAVFPALLVALALQALLFQFGGFLSLGVNAFDMAFPAFLCGLAFRPLLNKVEARWAIAVCGFGAGFAGIFLSCLLCCSALYLSGGDFKRAAGLIFLAHVPVMLAEGVITAFAALFVKRTKPEIFIDEIFGASQKTETKKCVISSCE